MKLKKSFNLSETQSADVKWSMIYVIHEIFPLLYIIEALHLYSLWRHFLLANTFLWGFSILLQSIGCLGRFYNYIWCPFMLQSILFTRDFYLIKLRRNVLKFWNFYTQWNLECCPISMKWKWDKALGKEYNKYPRKGLIRYGLGVCLLKALV